MRLFFVCLLCLATCFSAMAQEDGKAIEEMILAKADKDIEKYRKSEAIIEVVDKKGLFTFRGFHGKYDVSIKLSKGNIIKKEIHIQKDSDNKFRIVVE